MCLGLAHIAAEGEGRRGSTAHSGCVAGERRQRQRRQLLHCGGGRTEAAWRFGRICCSCAGGTSGSGLHSRHSGLLGTSAAPPAASRPTLTVGRRTGTCKLVRGQGGGCIVGWLHGVAASPALVPPALSKICMVFCLAAPPPLCPSHSCGACCSGKQLKLIEAVERGVGAMNWQCGQVMGAVHASCRWQEVRSGRLRIVPRRPGGNG